MLVWFHSSLSAVITGTYFRLRRVTTRTSSRELMWCPNPHTSPSRKKRGVACLTTDAPTATLMQQQGVSRVCTYALIAISIRYCVLRGKHLDQEATRARNQRTWGNHMCDSPVLVKQGTKRQQAEGHIRCRSHHTKVPITQRRDGQ